MAPTSTLSIGPLVKYAVMFALFLHPSGSFSQHRAAVFVFLVWDFISD